MIGYMIKRCYSHLGPFFMTVAAIAYIVGFICIVSHVFYADSKKEEAHTKLMAPASIIADESDDGRLFDMVVPKPKSIMGIKDLASVFSSGMEYEVGAMKARVHGLASLAMHFRDPRLMPSAIAPSTLPTALPCLVAPW